MPVAECRVTDAPLAMCVQYLTHALELKDSYKLLKPHVEGLLVQVRALLWQLVSSMRVQIRGQH